MSKIFISYRRADSHSVTDRIYDSLKNRITSCTFFKDVTSIPTGANFLEYSHEFLVTSKAVLVIIGPDWASSLLMRQGDENDYVRIEVENALSADVKIIPVLVEGAKMPTTKEVPFSIAKICYLNATKVRPDPDFENDISRLMKILLADTGQGDSSSTGNTVLRFGLIILLLSILCVIGIKYKSQPDEPETQPAKDGITGIWQGITQQSGDFEFPSFMKISQDGAEIEGFYYLEVVYKGKKTAYAGTRNIIADKSSIQDNHIKLVADNGNSKNKLACLDLTLEMDLSNDGNILEGTWTGTDNTVPCLPGTIILSKLSILSKLVFDLGEDKTIQLKGKNIKWYADFKRQKLLNSKNTYTPNLTKDQVYYITQTVNNKESAPYKLEITVE